MIELVKKRYQFTLENGHTELFIPMEHKIDGDFQKEDGSWNLSNPEWSRRVYAMDTKAIDECDIMYAMYTGHFGTTGTAFEVGYAKARGKQIVLYIPEWAKENNVSLMIFNSTPAYLTEDGSVRLFTDEYLNQFNQK